jgi:hypothetical protein
MTQQKHKQDSEDLTYIYISQRKLRKYVRKSNLLMVIFVEQIIGCDYNCTKLNHIYRITFKYGIMKHSDHRQYFYTNLSFLRIFKMFLHICFQNSLI